MKNRRATALCSSIQQMILSKHRQGKTKGKYFWKFIDLKEKKSREADNSLKDGRPVSVYLLFQKALYLMENDKPTEGKELFSHCLGHPDSYDTYLRQLFLKEAIGHQINMSLLAKQMDLAAWDRCTVKVIKVFQYKFNSRIKAC